MFEHFAASARPLNSLSFSHPTSITSGRERYLKYLGLTSNHMFVLFGVEYIRVIDLDLSAG
jgi:hypothetical protein